MATNYTTVSGVLGVNLEGHELPPTGELITPAGGAPRVPPGTPVLISGNKIAVYGVAKAALNPAVTVAFENFVTGTMASTTGTADKIGIYVTLNTTTAATGEYLFARTGLYAGA